MDAIRLLDVAVIAELGEDTEGALGVEEADVQTFSALAGVLVDELYTLVCHFCERFVGVRHGEGNVVDPFTALFDELGDGAFRRGCFEELDLGLSDLEEGGLYLLISYFFDVVALEPEDTFVVGQGLFDTLDSDTKMLDV